MDLRTATSKTLRRLNSKAHNWFHSFAQGSKIQYLQENLRQSQIANDYLMSMWLQSSEPHPNPLLAHGRQYFSQSDEDGIIREILNRIGLHQGVLVEIGCGDGLENNTLNLLLQGWKSVWVDAGPLTFNPECNPKQLSFQQEFVTAENILSIVGSGLTRIGSDHVDLLSIDIDGNDGYIAQALLDSGMRPKVVILEINELLPPPIRFAQPYVPDYRWDKSKNSGWSLQSMSDLMEPFGYLPIACNLQTGVNAFFIRSDYVENFSDVPREIEQIFVGRSIHPQKYRNHRTEVVPSLVESVLRGMR